MRALVVGVGAVGARAARQLAYLGALDDLAVADTDVGAAEAMADSLGESGRACYDLDWVGPGDVVVLAMPGRHGDLARQALEQGAHVVSTADSVTAVEELLSLEDLAVGRGLHLVVGAGFSPGLTCVLAALGGRAFERVEEVHVAKVGTGGPACAHQHHDALAGEALAWRDGSWERRRAGSGRELCWFPDPLRGVDCYRAALADPLLLVRAFPGASRVTSRLGASRRDRLTAHLPMLRRPHPEGDIGAVRVEVRGAQGVALDDRVLGAVDRPAVAAGTVAAMAARWALDGRLARPGAGGLAELVEPGPFLAALADRGLKVAVFEGSQAGGAPAPVGGAAGGPA